MNARALSFDVAVTGAGCAGIIAAVAAARAGARTALVERSGFPGGVSTAVLDTFYAFFTAGEGGRKVVAGLPDEPVRRLLARGKAFSRPNSFGSGTGYTYDPETLKIVWAELLREAGVTVLFHSFVSGVEVADARVRRLLLATKAGPTPLEAAAFVDASGDADVVHFAGGQLLEDTEWQQPATLTFRMAPVDIDRFKAEGRPRFRELVGEARAAGYTLASESGSLHASATPGVAQLGVTRIAPPDLNDPCEPGRVEMDGLAQVEEWVRFLRRYMPGFAQAEIVAIGSEAGIRETRRIHGRYVLQEADVVSARRFHDQIALCGAPIEDLAAAETRWTFVANGGAYGIPWRCLVPAGLRGVVVAGRCLSASHAAHASARSMGTCMALGQAAGTAAALAVARAIEVGAVDVQELQQRLIAAGADLGDPADRQQERLA